MDIKELDWSKVYINNGDNNPFTMGAQGFIEKSSNEYNNFLIKDYIDSENKYMESYNKVFKNINHEFAFKRDEDLVWVCSHCGYVHNNAEAPKSCPICGSSRIYFGLQY